MTSAASNSTRAQRREESRKRSFRDASLCTRSTQSVTPLTGDADSLPNKQMMSPLGRSEKGMTGADMFSEGVRRNFDFELDRPDPTNVSMFDVSNTV